MKTMIAAAVLLASSAAAQSFVSPDDAASAGAAVAQAKGLAETYNYAATKTGAPASGVARSIKGTPQPNIDCGSAVSGNFNGFVMNKDRNRVGVCRSFCETGGPDGNFACSHQLYTFENADGSDVLTLQNADEPVVSIRWGSELIARYWQPGASRKGSFVLSDGVKLSFPDTTTPDRWNGTTQTVTHGVVLELQ